MFTKPLPILEAKKCDSANSRVKRPRFPGEIGACAETGFGNPVKSREIRHGMFWKNSKTPENRAFSEIRKTKMSIRPINKRREKK
jgi:hypothetical protein